MSNTMQIMISEDTIPLSQVMIEITKLFRMSSEGTRSEAVTTIKSLLCTNIAGTADEFHNAATQLALNDNLDLAVLLVQKGIEKYSHNLDLYADLRGGGTDLGDYSNAQLAQQMLFAEFPAFEAWNWRAFTYMLNYLLEFKPDNYFTNCGKIIQEFRRFLPNDERSYMAEYNLLKNSNKNSAAVEILETAIKNLVVAPQCALKLSDEYLDRGDYSKAIVACNKAAFCSAESQPSVKISYIFYNRALARDAIINQSVLSEEKISTEDVLSVIKDYSLAIKLKLNPTAASNARDRIWILKTLFDVNYEETSTDNAAMDINTEDIDLDDLIQRIDKKIKELES